MTEPTSPQPVPPEQPPPPPPGPYAPQYGGYPYAPPFNTYAILALVLAIAVLPPLGIYFGYKAKEQIAATGERGVELATAAIVIGWVLTSIYVLMCCFMGAMFSIPLFANAAV
ncbi:DUF4190 domain-containing protein [Catelliglobosispora koreensis]|uniref:DUF4190 domain-containing protein n=1 Tax=Catelliglobosispora koreensis TaxID=129052 RepID=UPI00036C19B0|nr:DUF4190 domain-containing protein [Catelliglobosispora koreensis]